MAHINYRLNVEFDEVRLDQIFGDLRQDCCRIREAAMEQFRAAVSDAERKLNEKPFFKIEPGRVVD